ncbi:MFS transporter [Pirellulaceae bacterium SH467]
MKTNSISSSKLRLQFEWLSWGWLPIVIGAMAMTATYPGRTHGLGMVTEPLLQDLHLDDPAGRVFFASLNFWGTILGASFCLPVGWLLDRVDRRAVLTGNMILLGLAVMWMASVESWQALFVGILLSRGLGQSALSVVSLSIVARSFSRKHLGVAMALYAVLAMPFHLLLIQGVGIALTDYQLPWRSVWSCVGIALLILSLSSLLLGGQKHPDGIEDPTSKEGGASLRMALQTPAFWMFSCTIALWGMIYSGVALFNVDIFRERGFDEKTYFQVLTWISIIAVASKFLFGWMVNFVSLSKLLAISLSVTSLSLAGLPWATHTWHAFLYGTAIGLASGAVALLFFATWAKLYGQRELGKIQGVAQMLTVLASASGPLVFSFSKQWTSSYTSIFQTLSAVMFVLAIAAWLTPIPHFCEAEPK